MSNKDRGTSEFFDIPKTVKISDKMLDRLQQRRIETGVAISTQMRRAVERELSEEEDVKQFTRPFVPLWGEIPAGPADWVIPESPEVYVRPPFEVPEDCYALTVKGKSMENAFGLSITNGFYVFLDPHVIRPTMIVHVEFSDGQFQHKATLKRWLDRYDGTSEFQPLNKDFKKIVVPNEVFVIKGGFYKAWDGISDMEDENAK